MRNCLTWISFWCLSLTALAQTPFPMTEGSRARYQACIEMKKGYVSGICILANQGECIQGSLFNEFGISALHFSYHPKKDKVKIHHTISMLNKWYIKKVLRKDLKQVMKSLIEGKDSYTDEHYHIRYTFKPLQKE